MKKFLAYTAALICLAGSSYGDITVKGILSSDTSMLINGNLTNTDWRNVETQHKYTETYQVNSGFGLGLEYSLLNKNQTLGLRHWPENLEVPVGVNYFLPQNITDYKLKDKLSPADAMGNTLIQSKQSYADDELTLQITSFYIRPRYIFSIQNFGLYAGLKLSYNLINAGGENSEELKLDNTLGYGLSLGTLVNNLWDIELSWDKLGSVNKTQNGETFEIQQMLLSAGYRFGYAKPIPKEIIETEKFEESIPEPEITPEQETNIMDSLFEEIYTEEQPVYAEPETIPAESILEETVKEQISDSEIFTDTEEAIEQAEEIIQAEPVEEKISEVERFTEPEEIIEPTEELENIASKNNIEQIISEIEEQVTENISATEEEIDTLLETAKEQLEETPEQIIENIPVTENIETAPKTASETAEEVRQRMLQRMRERRN